jgi:hypothetical protein
LQRDFAKIEKRGGESGRIGQELGDLANQMFGYWHRVRDRTMTRENVRRHVLIGADRLSDHPGPRPGASRAGADVRPRIDQANLRQSAAALSVPVDLRRGRGH